MSAAWSEPPGRWEPHLDALSWALKAATRPIPCRGPDRDLWTSDNAGERAAAAERCQPCPARTECLQAAVDEGIRDHVWGAVDFGSPRQRSAARQAASRPREA